MKMTSPLAAQIAKLARFVETRNYAGDDPYDALNSPLLRALSCGTKWGRIACIQALRQSPVNLRRLLGIRPGQNPKALGLFLEGYARLHRLEPRGEYAERARYLVRRLAALRALSRSGHGWGYNFAWQSRAFYLPAFTPTVVCSSFVAHALLDAAEAFGLEEARRLALPAGEFILGDLNRTPEGDTFCFSYSALDRYAVHNASLLGASLLIRLHPLAGGAAMRDAALAALAYSMKHQREDGSWYYSERGSSRWIDSFHTGFNLEAVRRFLAAGEGLEYGRAFARGVRFYADRFFLPDGAPKYYSESAYPIDIHAAAEAVSFFADEGPEFAPLADRVLRWTLDNLADAGGFFYYRKGPRRTNRIPYMRWGQAWMFRALAAYAAKEGGAEAPRGLESALQEKTS
jgi:hypothetical protein